MARARKSGGTEGQANESAILEELRELSETAHEAVDTAREFDDANDRLTKAAEVVGKAWSKGFVGYHARMYLNHFKPVRPPDFFDTNSGLNNYSETQGDWAEFDPDAVVEFIRQRAGSPEFLELDRVAVAVGKIFDHVRGTALAILSALPQSGFIEKAITEIEESTQSISMEMALSTWASKTYRCADRKRSRRGS